MILKDLAKVFTVLFLTVIILSSCDSKKKIKSPLFEVLESKQTGLDFVNKLKPDQQFNMFNYMYFYNGGGIGAGDFNNDGLVDLFFSSNQDGNRLYLNRGGMQFNDVTKQAAIPVDKAWSTGVSVVDINNDGLLDIYVCRVGQYEVLKSRNQMLVCTGIKEGVPVFEDRAAQYGIDFSGFSTQSLFFDYDLDGDLDMFLMNHAVHQNGSFAPRERFINTYSDLSGDRIFRNDTKAGSDTSSVAEPKFTDVTKETGINSSSIGYGLGIAAADINLDGYPDLYIGNDFHENDYLYINGKNGTFRDENNQRLMHTSKFSMGVDVADVNNDGFPEIISMDMLPSDPYILKRSLGEDEYDIFRDKISAGYNYQYSRNALQLNRRNGMFSETGLYSGIYATDWSWAALFMDFDNDGLKDLFISNGIPKRLNDMDYVNFISNDEIQLQLREKRIDEYNMALVNKFPEIKIPNKFYHNSGNLQFVDIADSIANDMPTYSNGSVYADLDNDGDLDVVVNNIDEAVMVYENKSNDNNQKPFAKIKLRGSPGNINAIGTKVVLFTRNGIRTYENFPVKGFQSSMQVPIHIGLANTIVDSAVLVWPDNTCQPVSFTNAGQLSFTWTNALPEFDYGILNSVKSTLRPLENITSAVNLLYRHKENSFNEFNREPLMPHMVSAEGPALAVGDANGDGLDDVFIGSAKGQHSAIFLQNASGKFSLQPQPSMLPDSMYEDVDACWADVNNDGHADLVIASGGNEYYGSDIHRAPRVYLNDGNARFKKLDNAFSQLTLTASCIAPYDFNNDGFIDLFIGGRAVPWEYGNIPQSYLLQNDGSGRFIDVTAKIAAEVSGIGLVTGAAWADMDNDNDKDLLVCCEWGGIYAFVNDQGKFSQRELTGKKGWWNFIMPFDADNDGDLDLVAGNLGLNSRLKASTDEPVRLYFNDFDDNGKKEQVLTYYVEGKELCFVNKDELQKKLPVLKKKFLYAEDFAKASVTEIFGSEKMKGAKVLSADYFANAILINNGSFNFALQEMPWQAQLTCYRDATVIDANNDSLPDILLAGNYYDNNIQMGRYDADLGTILVNGANGKFRCESTNHIIIKGQARRIRPITIGGQKAFIVAKNNDSAMVVGYSPGRN